MRLKKYVPQSLDLRLKQVQSLGVLQWIKEFANRYKECGYLEGGMQILSLLSARVHRCAKIRENNNACAVWLQSTKSAVEDQINTNLHHYLNKPYDVCAPS